MFKKKWPKWRFLLIYRCYMATFNKNTVKYGDFWQNKHNRAVCKVLFVKTSSCQDQNYLMNEDKKDP